MIKHSRISRIWIVGWLNWNRLLLSIIVWNRKLRIYWREEKWSYRRRSQHCGVYMGQKNQCMLDLVSKWRKQTSLIISFPSMISTSTWIQNLKWKNIWKHSNRINSTIIPRQSDSNLTSNLVIYYIPIVTRIEKYRPMTSYYKMTSIQKAIINGFSSRSPTQKDTIKSDSTS